MTRFAFLAVAAVAAACTAPAASGATTGTTFGGTTGQSFPVIVQLSKSGNEVTRSVIALRLTCTSGGVLTVPDGYLKLPISKTGKFGAAFGPTTSTSTDGTKFDVQGKMSGALNKARTSITGMWQLTITNHDATGAVTDTCTATVHWTARQ